MKRYCYRNELEFGAAGASCIIKDKCQAKPAESIVLLLNQLRLLRGNVQAVK
ncbi:hypothetical protein HMPREF1548_00107 [Clostridium sp. KLE 1755]|nr:hypothetical protein HMPREF1548_00107 [Clostridium sp. KLE 1755]